LERSFRFEVSSIKQERQGTTSPASHFKHQT
jgi:hypothetical protein